MSYQFEGGRNTKIQERKNGYMRQGNLIQDSILTLMYQLQADLMYSYISKQPIFVRKDTINQFQWRIRNLPWPKSVYVLEVDNVKNEIVVKTTNKKYYKRIQVPDLQREGIALDPAQLSSMYQHNTLIISVHPYLTPLQYNKPTSVMAMEAKRREIAKKSSGMGMNEDNMDCKQQ